MQQRLQVLAIENVKGVAKKSGNPYDMDKAQCVLHEASGPTAVGELILPKEHPCKAGGFYEATFKLGRTMDGKIAAVIESLRASASSPKTA